HLLQARLVGTAGDQISGSGEPALGSYTLDMTCADPRPAGALFVRFDALLELLVDQRNVRVVAGCIPAHAVPGAVERRDEHPVPWRLAVEQDRRVEARQLGAGVVEYRKVFRRRRD